MPKQVFPSLLLDRERLRTSFQRLFEHLGRILESSLQRRLDPLRVLVNLGRTMRRKLDTTQRLLQLHESRTQILRQLVTLHLALHQRYFVVQSGRELREE